MRFCDDSGEKVGGWWPQGREVRAVAGDLGVTGVGRCGQGGLESGQDPLGEAEKRREIGAEP